MFSESSVAFVKKQLGSNQNEVIRFRYLDLFAQASGISPEIFDKVLEIGVIRAIFEAFDTDDLLQKLNAAQLLEETCRQYKGITLLQESGMLQKIHAVLKQEDPADGLILPRIITVAGTISKYSSEHFTLVANTIPLLETLNQLLSSEEDEVVVRQRLRKSQLIDSTLSFVLLRSWQKIRLD